MSLSKILKKGLEKGGETIFLLPNLPPCANVLGRIVPILKGSLSPKEIEAYVLPTMGELSRKRFLEDGSCDYSSSFFGHRFRINVYLTKGELAAVFRKVPQTIRNVEELNIPKVVIETVLKIKRGLVIIAGPTGSGKSTTMAALVELLNRNRNIHIITVEDPIEYLHRPKKALISQREIGVDTISFEFALTHLLRQDPDVIVLGEARDEKSFAFALRAAETGHLVFMTMHAHDTPTAIDRIIDSFPMHKRRQIRFQISQNIVLAIGQRLLVRIDGNGRILACEVLFGTKAVRNLIREGKTHMLYTLMEGGKKENMQTLDQAISRLYEDGKIPLVFALEYTKNQARIFESRRVKLSHPERVLSPPPKIEDKAITYKFPNRNIRISDIDSSGYVQMMHEGILYVAKSDHYQRNAWITDFSIMVGKNPPFTLKKHIIINYRIDELRENAHFLFMRMEIQTDSGTYIIPEDLSRSEIFHDKEWHTLVLDIPKVIEGKTVRAYLLEFSSEIKVILISSVSFI